MNQVLQAAELAATLRRLREAGLPNRILAKFAASGAAALPQLKALVALVEG